MKKIMKKTMWTLLIATMFAISAKAETTGRIKYPGATEGTIVLKDSIPPLADSVDFINNKDLAEFLRILQLVMLHPEFIKKNAIEQYEMIVSNAGQIFNISRRRWDEKHKIKTK